MQVTSNKHNSCELFFLLTREDGLFQLGQLLNYSSYDLECQKIYN